MKRAESKASVISGESGKKTKEKFSLVAAAWAQSWSEVSKIKGTLSAKVQHIQVVPFPHRFRSSLTRRRMHL
jgi:hypothetical protein